MNKENDTYYIDSDDDGGWFVTSSNGKRLPCCNRGHAQATLTVILESEDFDAEFQSLLADAISGARINTYAVIADNIATQVYEDLRDCGDPTLVADMERRRRSLMVRWVHVPMGCVIGDMLTVNEDGLAVVRSRFKTDKNEKHSTLAGGDGYTDARTVTDLNMIFNSISWSVKELAKPHPDLIVRIFRTGDESAARRYFARALERRGDIYRSAWMFGDGDEQAIAVTEFHCDD